MVENHHIYSRRCKLSMAGVSTYTKPGYLPVKILTGKSTQRRRSGRNVCFDCVSFYRGRSLDILTWHDLSLTINIDWGFNKFELYRFFACAQVVLSTSQIPDVFFLNTIRKNADFLHERREPEPFSFIVSKKNALILWDAD